MDYSNVLYFEASANYSILHFSDGVQKMNAYTLKYYERLLVLNEGFVRIHRRFLVNRNIVKSYNENEVILKTGKKLPISRRRNFTLYP